MLDFFHAIVVKRIGDTFSLFPTDAVSIKAANSSIIVSIISITLALVSARARGDSTVNIQVNFSGRIVIASQKAGNSSCIAATDVGEVSCSPRFVKLGGEHGNGDGDQDGPLVLTILKTVNSSYTMEC